MASLHPDLIELTFNAALKAFWRKEALRKFLRECNIKDAFIATWAAEESKRDFLDRLFATLQRTDNGRGAILRMARFLASKKQFPDLQGWEESEQMLRAARASTSALADYLVAEDQKTEDEEAKRRALKAHRERQ
ncbi:MAG TPA: hypothetical protein VFR37_11650, partial [Longimicrobium sp.]|nr:hypothetical protein [Longimicrobium sp.]